MKIRITDLMDYYRGDPVNMEPQNFNTADRSAYVRTEKAGNRRIRKPLLIAAALVLIVTAGFSGSVMLSRTAGGNALDDGDAPLSVLETFAPEEPTEAFVQASAEEETPTETAEPVIPSYTITGAKVRETYDLGNGITWGQSLLTVNNICCHGNMVNIDGTYYTLTESGPELLETTNLHTTVDLYGTWEVDIDYAVVDGQLAFYNNTSAAEYTIVDGEKLTAAEYRERYGLNTNKDEVEWTTPAVAVAEPLDGSADTVILRIYRKDKPAVERVAYTFLYNIFTGEITDPLANVPDLFDHGSFGYAIFNRAATRAIAHIFDTYDSTGYLGIYICDLVTGEMTELDDFAAPLLPEAENPETTFSASDVYWADDDTLLISILESTPNGKEWDFAEDGTEISPLDYTLWLCSYDMITGTVNYQQQEGDISFSTTGYNSSHSYLEISSKNDSRIQILDTATGAHYLLDQELDSRSWDDTNDRIVVYDSSDEVYLIDAAQKCWIKLSDYLEVPDPARENPNNIHTTVKLLTNDYLCLMTEDTVYCYCIPDDLPMMPLTEK